MSADGYMHNPVWVVKHLLATEYEPELIAQIFGGNAETLIACAQSIEKHYSFGGIELNMWCPSPKIMKCAAWSGMLKDKKKTLAILKEIATSLNTPFSLKTRIGLSEDDKDEQFAFLQEASKYVWMIGLHGRTYKQSHWWFVDREYIYKLKQACPETVIIGNGGIRSYQQAYSDCWSLDWVMIAQSAIGNPRVLIDHEPTTQERFRLIFDHLALAMAQEQYFRTWSCTEQAQATWILKQPSLAHLQTIASEIKNNPQAYTWYYTPREFRKYLFNYIAGLEKNKQIKKMIPKAKEYHELVTLLQWFEQSLLV